MSHSDSRINSPLQQSEGLPGNMLSPHIEPGADYPPSLQQTNIFLWNKIFLFTRFEMSETPLPTMKYKLIWMVWFGFYHYMNMKCYFLHILFVCVLHRNLYFCFTPSVNISFSSRDLVWCLRQLFTNSQLLEHRCLEIWNNSHKYEVEGTLTDWCSAF